MSIGFNEINALSDLLVPEEDDAPAPKPTFTPGSIGPVAPKTVAKTDVKPKDPYAIWDDDEVPPEDALGVGDAPDPLDKRKRPTYEILYKQDVMTEDLFLGTEKTPSSSDCSHMTLRIHFPGHKMADLELDVTKTSLKAESRTYKLSLFLPMHVNSDEGKAKWDARKESLVVTLPIVRDEW